MVDLSPGFQQYPDNGFEETLTWSVPEGAPITTNGLTVTIYGEEKSQAGTHILILTNTITAPDGQTFSKSVILPVIVNAPAAPAGDPCDETRVVAIQEPQDMEVAIGKGQATQLLSAYDDEVSLDARAKDQPFECGPLVYKLVGKNNETPGFVAIYQQG